MRSNVCNSGGKRAHPSSGSELGSPGFLVHVMPIDHYDFVVKIKYPEVHKKMLEKIKVASGAAVSVMTYNLKF